MSSEATEHGPPNRHWKPQKEDILVTIDRKLNNLARKLPYMSTSSAKTLSLILFPSLF